MAGASGFETRFREYTRNARPLGRIDAPRFCTPRDETVANGCRTARLRILETVAQLFDLQREALLLVFGRTVETEHDLEFKQALALDLVAALDSCFAR